MRRAFLAGLAALLPLAARAQAPTPRQTVLDFYDLVFRQKRVAEGFARHVGPTYTQHNPRVPDGAEAAIRFLGGRFRDNPAASSELKRVVAEGDLVVLHHHSRSGPEDRGAAIVDIFRVANGRIVEHWDVIQPVPETAANTNTMF